MRVQRDYNTKTRNFVNGVHTTFCINCYQTLVQ